MRGGGATRKGRAGGIEGTAESLFGDVPELNIDKALKIAKNRIEWKKFFMPQNAPAHSEVPAVAAERAASQEVPRRRRRRT